MKGVPFVKKRYTKGASSDKKMAYKMVRELFSHFVAILSPLHRCIREHAEHCDFFANTSRNKKFALRACEQRKNLGSTSK